MSEPSVLLSLIRLSLNGKLLLKICMFSVKFTRLAIERCIFEIQNEIQFPTVPLTNDGCTFCMFF